MKKTLKTIGTITAIGTIMAGAYLYGTTQAETVTVAKEVEAVKYVEVIPDGYIRLSDSVPLKDIDSYFVNSDGTICFELKRLGNQLGSESNRSYEDLLRSLEDKTDDFNNSYVDMQTVTGYSGTADSLQLYFEDGTGYYWER